MYEQKSSALPQPALNSGQMLLSAGRSGPLDDGGAGVLPSAQQSAADLSVLHWPATICNSPRRQNVMPLENVCWQSLLQRLHCEHSNLKLGSTVLAEHSSTVLLLHLAEKSVKPQHLPSSGHQLHFSKRN